MVININWHKRNYNVAFQLPRSTTNYKKMEMGFIHMLSANYQSFVRNGYQYKPTNINEL